MLSSTMLFSSIFSRSRHSPTIRSARLCSRRCYNRCGSRLLLSVLSCSIIFFFSSRRRHTRCLSDWSSDVCSSDLPTVGHGEHAGAERRAEHCVSDSLSAFAHGHVPHDHRSKKRPAFHGNTKFWPRSEERRVGKECRCGGWANN